MPGPTAARSVGAVAAALLCASAASAAQRSGTVTFDIRIAAPATAQDVKLWFPYPTSDHDQVISELRFEGTYERFTLAREPESGALYLFAHWSRPAPERRLLVTFHARGRERRVPRLAERDEPFPVEVRRFLEPSRWIPSDDGRVKRIAAGLVAGRPSVVARARAVYDWVVENTRRDPSIPGCGTGDVDRALAARSGKCADIGSVYVTLARAAGVPAREIFGLRLGRPGETDISDGHHCWAEFYLPGTGWVPVDPADVLKEMQQRRVSLARVAAEREYYFGAVDAYRIVLHRGGRGVTFAEGNRSKVSYFMYPYAEVDGAPLDYCRPASFTYVIRFRED